MQPVPETAIYEADKKAAKTNIQALDVIKRGYGKLGNLGSVLIATILLIIIFSILSPYFLTLNNFVNIFRQSAPLAMVAVGITIVIISGGIDLSIASSISLCSVILAMLIKNTDVPLFFSVILVFILGILLGLFNGFLITLLKIPPIIATLATAMTFSGIAFTITQGYSINLPADNAIRYLGSGKIWLIPVSIILVVIIYFVIQWILQNTGFGRLIYGLGGNVEAVYLSGISVRKYTLIIYMICGFFAAFASILLTARVANGHPNNGGGMEMDAIAATVLGGTSIYGGVGSVWGLFSACSQ
ncbi:MAG: ABC transporter permease [Anaerolineales bacterium]|nr:ABC transporter permease [Anaerolineales bacterium]